MFKKIIILMVAVILLLLNSCKDNITDSEDKPGRRDYEWIVDTLNIFYPAYKIWGSSPTNVWTINESDFNNSIWHFDGTKWSTDGAFRFISPHALWGFSANNVYIGGSSGGKIFQFNGVSWNQVSELTKEGIDDVAIENIWGETANDLYAVGSGPDNKGYFNRSVIAHYFNNRWNMLNTDEIKGDVVHLYKNKPDKKIYFRLTKIGGTEHIDSTIIYEYTKGKYIQIYSSLETKGLQADISLINNEVYFILGNEIAKRVNNQFKVILNVNSPNFYQRIWGRNSKDIFLLMTDGLAHYNGSNLDYLFYFSNHDAKPWTQIYASAIFEKEVFFVVDEPSTNLKLIYHGKLK